MQVCLGQGVMACRPGHPHISTSSPLSTILPLANADILIASHQTNNFLGSINLCISRLSYRMVPGGGQVQRLVAVLGVLRRAGKGALLSGAPLPTEDLSTTQRRALCAAGWVRGTPLATLVNFTGAPRRTPQPNSRACCQFFASQAHRLQTQSRSPLAWAVTRPRPPPLIFLESTPCPGF